MLECNPSFQESLDDIAQLGSEVATLESVISASALPAAVKNAAISQVFESLMDQKEITRLTATGAEQSNTATMQNRLNTRRLALTAAQGRRLTCAVIHLPGVTYTVEVDLARATIVHWEWQKR